MRGVVLISVREKCTLDKICKYNEMLKSYHRETIEGTILKLILKYRPFAM